MLGSNDCTSNSSFWGLFIWFLLAEPIARAAHIRPAGSATIASMKSGLLILLLAALAPAQDFDLIIRNGRIVDGTGNPSFTGDIAIRQGRIAAMGGLSGKTAARTIDAAGLTVTPGFIDIHNHSDNSIVTDGNAQSMIRQGVTSMIFGEGGSAAPSRRWKDFNAYFAQASEAGNLD